MEFKKCLRCGCFFMSNNEICCNCETKDKFDIAKLNNIIDENSHLNSVEDLSKISGINISNINRFINHNQISNIDNTL